MKKKTAGLKEKKIGQQIVKKKKGENARSKSVNFDGPPGHNEGMLPTTLLVAGATSGGWWPTLGLGAKLWKEIRYLW